MAKEFSRATGYQRQCVTEREAERQRGRERWQSVLCGVQTIFAELVECRSCNKKQRQRERRDREAEKERVGERESTGRARERLKLASFKHFH